MLTHALLEIEPSRNSLENHGIKPFGLIYIFFCAFREAILKYSGQNNNILSRNHFRETISILLVTRIIQMVYKNLAKRIVKSFMLARRKMLFERQSLLVIVTENSFSSPY